MLYWERLKGIDLWILFIRFSQHSVRWVSGLSLRFCTHIPTNKRQFHWSIRMSTLQPYTFSKVFWMMRWVFCGCKTCVMPSDDMGMTVICGIYEGEMDCMVPAYVLRGGGGSRLLTYVRLWKILERRKCVSNFIRFGRRRSRSNMDYFRDEKIRWGSNGKVKDDETIDVMVDGCKFGIQSDNIVVLCV